MTSDLTKKNAEFIHNTFGVDFKSVNMRPTVKPRPVEDKELTEMEEMEISLESVNKVLDEGEMLMDFGEETEETQEEMTETQEEMTETQEELQETQEEAEETQEEMQETQDEVQETQEEVPEITRTVETQERDLETQEEPQEENPPIDIVIDTSVTKEDFVPSSKVLHTDNEIESTLSRKDRVSKQDTEILGLTMLEKPQSSLVRHISEFKDVPALKNTKTILWDLNLTLKDNLPPVKLLVERLLLSFIEVLKEQGRNFITLEEADISAHLINVHDSLVPALEKVGFIVIESYDEPIIGVKSLTDLGSMVKLNLHPYRSKARDRMFQEFLENMEDTMGEGRRIGLSLLETVTLETVEGVKQYMVPRLTVEELKMFIIHVTSRYELQYKVWNDKLFLWRNYRE